MTRTGSRVRSGIGMLLVALGVALAFGMAPAVAAAGVVGTVDPTFGNDRPVALITGPGGIGYDPGGMVALTDGAGLVADGDDIGVTRLDGTGTPDASFGSGGTVSVPGGSVDRSSAAAVAVTPSGSYIAAGSVGGNDEIGVAEFSSMGVLDTSFASDSSLAPGVFVPNNDPVQGQRIDSSSAEGVVVEPGGTIVVVGTEFVGAAPGTEVLAVLWLTSAGDLIKSYTLQGDGLPTMASAVALGPSGAIYVAGTENGDKAVVARLTSSFQLDTTFDPSGSTPGVLTTTLGGTDTQISSLAIR